MSIYDDKEAMAAIETLKRKGVTPDQAVEVMRWLERDAARQVDDEKQHRHHGDPNTALYEEYREALDSL